MTPLTSVARWLIGAGRLWHGWGRCRWRPKALAAAVRELIAADWLRTALGEKQP
jgi:hypothetical protein